METTEWAMFLVDDLKHVTELSNYDRATDPLPITIKNNGRYTSRFQHKISLQKFLQRAEELRAICDKNNCYLGGWCGISNPLFRANKYKVNVLADGRAWIVKKSDLRFDEKAQMIDDLCWTALNIKHHGIVIVDQWICPDCRRYTKGGFGSIEARMEQKLEEAAHLVKTYPELITYKKKARWPEGSHVILRHNRTKPTLKI
jgi:hypothetical protein